MKHTLKYIRETASTNALLKLMIRQEALDGMTVVYTDYQQSGRGQGDNVWESEKGKNLLFSIYLPRPELPIEEQFLISCISSLALLSALRQAVGDSCRMENFSIKWPNDIYWQEKKLGGMLIENTWQGRAISHSVIGVGINVNQQQFYSSAPNPVSLRQLSGKRFARKKLLNEIIQAFKHYLQQDSELIRSAYHQELFRKDGFHLYSDGKEQFEARIIEVETDGRILLESSLGLRKGYYFKEVAFVI